VLQARLAAEHADALAAVSAAMPGAERAGAIDDDLGDINGDMPSPAMRTRAASVPGAQHGQDRAAGRRYPDAPAADRK
jgi:hypothetical protein